MGTQISKTGQTYKEREPDQGSLPSTPILTPKNRDMSELDPRSPSAHIVRTPIQLSNGLNKNPQTPVIGEINTSFEIHTDEDNTFEKTSEMFDPRSPSIDFTRTPIVIEKSGVKLRNKKLDNVRKMTVDFSPVKKNNQTTETENETTEKQKGPILLESSPIIRKNDIKRNSFVGLLETNLDFIETDLDKAQKDLQIKRSYENLPLVPEEKSFEENDKKEESDEKEIESLDKQLESTEIINEVRIIESTTILNELEIIGDKEQKLFRIEEEIKEVIEVTIDPTSELDTSKMEVLVEQEELHTPIKKDKPVESENPVLDFDKKITNLIYEDQSVLLASPKQNKLKEQTNRTPLGDRNRNTSSQTKSGASKLRVHDKPRNEYVVSKIPVFKDKKSKQCENTPPMLKKGDSRIKKSQWDAEKTLII